MSPMVVSVLGAPRVTLHDRPVPLRGRPLLLALRLALAGPHPVPTDRLLEDLWGPDASDSGVLRVNITRLRQLVGDEQVVREPLGYRLDAQPSDAERFEELLQTAASPTASVRRRIADLNEALSLWRGDAYDGLARVPWIDAHATRLDDLRNHATTQLLALRSQTDQPAALIPDLLAAVEAAPLDEQRAELLAVAQYRAGLQTEALRTVRALTDTLRDELGLEPGPALKDLEQRILCHEPTLQRAPDERRTRGETRARAGDGDGSGIGEGGGGGGGGSGALVDSTVGPTGATDAGAADLDSRLRAASALTRAGAYAEALEILDLAAEHADDSRDRIGLARCLVARARTLTMAGTGDPAACLDRARDLARAERDGPVLAACAMVRFGRGTSTDIAATLVELTEPLELLTADAPERIDLLCAAAIVVMLASPSGAPERLLAEAESLHATQHNLRSEAVLCTARSILELARLGDLTTAEADAHRALELANSAEDPTLIVIAIHALLRTRLTRGDLDGADELVEPLRRAGHTAMLPFAIVRSALVRVTTALARGELEQVPALIDEVQVEGDRLRTVSAPAAIVAQRAGLGLELEMLHELADDIRPLAAQRGPGHFTVILELAGGRRPDEPRIADLVDDVRNDDARPVFVALATELAVRDGDESLASWCLPRLEALGERTVTVGLGTVVLAFAPHYRGLAHLVLGDLDTAVVELERALELSDAAGAGLWSAHSAVRLAVALRRRDGPGDAVRADRLLDTVRSSPVMKHSARLARAVAEAGGAPTV